MVKSIHLEEGQVMRALFTTTAGSGHFHPLVPLAQAARSAGYEVAFACPRSLCPRIEALGFLAIAAGRDGDEDPEMQQALASLPRYLEHSPMEANRYMLAVVFGRINGRLMTPDLLHTCQRWRPDVLVREAYEFGAVLVADYLDLPHAAVLVDPNTVWPAPLSDALAVQLDALRQVYGLSPDPTLQSLYRYLSFSFEPPGYRTPGTPVPPTLHHLHAPVFDRIGGE